MDYDFYWFGCLVIMGGFWDEWNFFELSLDLICGIFGTFIYSLDDGIFGTLYEFLDGKDIVRTILLFYILKT